MSSVVLDASALIAVLRREPGAERLATLIENSAISAVNYSEVIKKTVERGGSRLRVEVLVNELAIDVLPFDRAQGSAAALFYPASKHLGLSFADRACLALAQSLGSPVATAEQKWAKLSVGVEVMLIRGGAA